MVENGQNKRKSLLINKEFHKQLLDLQYEIYKRTGKKMFLTDIIKEAVKLYIQKMNEEK
ncbi:MAG: hypothetical protein ACP5L4_01930 [Thermoplasmata archaeon]